MSKAGRPPKIREAEQAVLRQMVTDRPTSTLTEIARELAARTGIEAHEATSRKSLREAGVTRLRGESGLEAQARATPRRYGYTDAHRRHDPDQSDPSCLTDAEWDLVANLFQMAGGVIRPACRAGASWRRVATGCARGARGGCCRTISRLGRMSPRRFAVGVRRGSSSRCMIDGGGNGASARGVRSHRRRRCWMRHRPAARRRVDRAALMRASRSRGASAAWWSIPWGSCWR